MRLWRFNDPSGNQFITDDEIIKDYFPYWKEQMIKVGKEDLISHENCIEDFVVVHWAWEVHDGK